MSSFTSVLECSLWSLWIRRRVKLKNSSAEWQHPWRIVQLNTKIILSLPTALVERSVLIIRSFSWIALHAHLYIPVSLPWFHCILWSAFGIHSLFLVHSLILHHCSCCISACCCSKHDSKRRSLSMRVSRREWPVPQLKGVYGMVRVLRALHCPLVHSKSLLPRSKVSEPKNLSHPDDKRNTNRKHKKFHCDNWNGVVSWNVDQLL